MAEIQIKPNLLPLLFNFVRTFKRSDPLPFVTFIINNKINSLKIIGGPSEALQVLDIPLEANKLLKTGEWSINASLFKTYCLSPIQANKPLVIDVDYLESTKYPQLKALTDDGAWRSWQAVSICEKHIKHLTELSNKTFQTISTNTAKTMIEIAQAHTPFEFFELKKDSQDIRLQRNDTIIPYVLPGNMNSDIDIVLNQESTLMLDTLCQYTKEDTLQIYFDNEHVIFSDGVQTVTSSLLSLAEFYQRDTISYETESRLIVNAFEFRDELREYIKVDQIRHTNQGFVYIDNDDVMVSGLGDITNCARFITTLEHTLKEKHLLYRINLRDIIKVKIKGVVSAHQMKLQFLKGSDGSRKLGFYNNLESKHPYDSVVVELDHSLNDKVLKLKAKYQKKLGNKSGKQMDMWLFDDT